jgi:hypothetical protein
VLNNLPVALIAHDDARASKSAPLPSCGSALLLALAATLLL